MKDLLLPPGFPPAYPTPPSQLRPAGSYITTDLETARFARAGVPVTRPGSRKIILYGVFKKINPRPPNPSPRWADEFDLVKKVLVKVNHLPCTYPALVTKNFTKLILAYPALARKKTYPVEPTYPALKKKKFNKSYSTYPVPTLYLPCTSQANLNFAKLNQLTLYLHRTYPAPTLHLWQKLQS